MTTMFAFTRAKPIQSVQALSAMGRHGARMDRTAANRMRADADMECRAVGFRALDEEDGKGIYRLIGTTAPGEPLPWVADYRAAWRARVEKSGARTRKGSAVALHILAAVSPAWLSEDGGNPHDPASERVEALIRGAVAWGERTFGKGATIAARYDCDEEGSGVVDLLVAPVENLKFGKSPEPRPAISIRAALARIAREHDRPASTSYAALNDSWHAYAAQYLDARLERGKASSSTRRQHIPPDQYKAGMVALEARRQAAETELAETQRQIKAARQELDRLQHLAGDVADAALAAALDEPGPDLIDEPPLPEPGL